MKRLHTRLRSVLNETVPDFQEVVGERKRIATRKGLDRNDDIEFSRDAQLIDPITSKSDIGSSEPLRGLSIP